MSGSTYGCPIFPSEKSLGVYPFCYLSYLPLRRTTRGHFKKDVSPPDAPTSHGADSTYRSLVLVVMVSADRLLQLCPRSKSRTIGFQRMTSACPIRLFLVLICTKRQNK